MIEHLQVYAHAAGQRKRSKQLPPPRETQCLRRAIPTLQTKSRLTDLKVKFLRELPRLFGRAYLPFKCNWVAFTKNEGEQNDAFHDTGTNNGGLRGQRALPT